MPIKRTRKPKVVSNDIKTIDNPLAKISNSGLSEALLGLNPGNCFGTQLSQVDTIFKNNRWYLISNMRQLLSEIYVEHGLVQTVVDVPVDDGMRGGVDIISGELDPEDIEQLKSVMEEKEDLTTYGQALKWNRLFGGAGVIIMNGDDPSTPFDYKRVQQGEPLEFRDVDMWELFWSKQNTSDYSAAIDTDQLNDVEYYNYYGIQLHWTRVMKMVGLKAPSFIRPRLRGWGFSIMEALVRSINQYLKANDLSFEVLDEFKIDVFKIKNLTNTLLTNAGTQAVQNRVQLANMQKNYQHAITMDAEDGYDQKELSFTGLAEVMQGIRMQIASDLRMPLTKVFGISAAGFSSGEDDIENYNAMVESQVRQKSKYNILRMIRIRCMQEFGMVPDDLSIKFKPLRILSAEQEENVKTQIFTRCLQARQAGEISSADFKNACNKDNLLPIQLDPTVDTLDMEGEDEASEDPKAAAAPKAKKSVTQPKEAKT